MGLLAHSSILHLYSGNGATHLIRLPGRLHQVPYVKSWLAPISASPLGCANTLKDGAQWSRLPLKKTS